MPDLYEVMGCRSDLCFYLGFLLALAIVFLPCMFVLQYSLERTNRLRRKKLLVDADFITAVF